MFSFGISVLGSGILAVNSELIIVAAVEKVDEKGNAG